MENLRNWKEVFKDKLNEISEKIRHMSPFERVVNMGDLFDNLQMSMAEIITEQNVSIDEFKEFSQELISSLIHQSQAGIPFPVFETEEEDETEEESLTKEYIMEKIDAALDRKDETSFHKWAVEYKKTVQ